MPEPSDSDFVLEHYKALRERFDSQGNRLWMRFHYFLVGEAALLGTYLTGLGTDGVRWPNSAISILGLLLTVLWSVIAAQDLWFYEQARKRLDEFKLRKVVSRIANWDEEDEKCDHYDVPWWKKPLCFRIAQCGVTSFASITPILFVPLWIAICVLA